MTRFCQVVVKSLSFSRLTSLSSNTVPPVLPFSYSDIIIEREILMQKYIHLVQIMETEKVAANQLRTQLEDQDTEIERLKAEVCMSASASACACIHKSTRTVAHTLRWSGSKACSSIRADGGTLESRDHHVRRSAGLQ